MTTQSIINQILPPPLSENAGKPVISVRFDNPQLERMPQLEKELRELRAKCVIIEIELSRVQAAAAEQLDAALSIVREQSQGEIQRLQTELAEANNRLDVMSAVHIYAHFTNI